MSKFLINVGLLVFLIFSLLICYGYFEMLYEKISRPQFRNLDKAGFAVLGFVVGGFLTLDFFIIKRLLKSIRKEIDAIKTQVNR